MNRRNTPKKTKPYVIHYAGRPEQRLEIHAESPLEAAFVFFQKSPMRNSFVIRYGTERMLFFDELKKAYPEVEEILQLSETERVSLGENLDRHYTISSTPQDDVTIGDVIAGKIMATFGLGLIGVVIAIIILIIKKCF